MRRMGYLTSPDEGGDGPVPAPDLIEAGEAAVTQIYVQGVAYGWVKLVCIAGAAAGTALLDTVDWGSPRTWVSAAVAAMVAVQAYLMRAPDLGRGE